MTIESPLKNLLTRKEAAAYLMITPKTLEVWANTRKGEIKYYRVGKYVVYKKEDLDKFIESRLIGG